MILKAFICLFKGHDINPDESIVGNVMIDKRNWLCRCHRCGLYEMHDGAISNQTITLTESGAKRVKMEFERNVANMMMWKHKMENGDGTLDSVPGKEIIHCKDCKNSKHWYRDRRRCFLWAEEGVSVFDDDFCSRGERKE